MIICFKMQITINFDKFIKCLKAEETIILSIFFDYSQTKENSLIIKYLS